MAFVLLGFCIGLLLGSFLNVCISRMPRGESVIGGRSKCPHCGHTVRWHDNIPLLSFILLRAKCRDCKSPISWRYPLVELSSGLISAGISFSVLIQHSDWAACSEGLPFWTASRIITIASTALLAYLLLGLFFTDWETHKLPDALTLTGALLGFLLTCVRAALLKPGEGDFHFTPRHAINSAGAGHSFGNVMLMGPEVLILGRIAAMLIALAVLPLMNALYRRLRGRNGIGFGDAKLLMMIAAFLGLKLTALALFIGVVLCALWALLLIARRKAHPLTKLPLGSFIALGGFTAMLSGDGLLRWYASLF